MYKYTLFTVVLFTQLFAQFKYGVGDQISIERQNMEFDYCYQNPPDPTFSFSEHAGKVFLLEMSASW